MNEKAEETTELKVIDKRMPLEPEAALPEDQTMSVVLVALNKNYQPEMVEKMMELQERFEKNEARKAFHLDLANFKENAPPVAKDKWNNAFKSWYTSLGNLLGTYNPVLGQYGLSISFPTPTQTDKTMEVYCKLSHRMGYSDTVSMTGPIDESPVGSQSGKRVRNALQDVKSTFTYLRSATCEAVLGVAGTEGTVNDNGNTAGSESTEFITDEEVKKLTKDINKFYTDGGQEFLKHLGAETVDTIYAGEQYNKAKGWIRDMKTKAKKIGRAPGEDG